ncbi:formyltransferase family protein [Candidatus Pelagibacter sp.]|nr:formyltransferase family protein [Candidatus Pelagibacter sp.]
MEALYHSGLKLDLAITLPDNKSKNKSGRVYIDNFCNENKIPLLKCTHISNSDVIKAISQNNIDWLFIIGWSQIASKDLLNSTKKGVLGIHPSLLPEGRGRASIPWAILKELNKTGITMFKMDSGIDTGPIVEQIEIPLNNKITATELYKKIVDAHSQLIKNMTKSILNEKLKFTPQDNSKATMWPGRKPEDGEIDLNGSVYDAEKLVRAVTHPYPGAFYFKNGYKHYVWSAKVLKGSDKDTKNTNKLKFNDGVLLILN